MGTDEGQSKRLREVTPPSRFGPQWLEAMRPLPRLAALDALAVSPGDVVVVVTAHPDDETLGIGGTLASLVEAGVEVHLVCATAGEAAFDAAGLSTPLLGQLRTSELARAAEALGLHGVELVGLPDGRVKDHEAQLTYRLSQVLDEHTTTAHVLALWEHDPHPDHAAVGRAARAAGRTADVPVSGFPVWAFHWCDPAATPIAPGAAVVAVGPFAFAKRRRALRAHRTQLTQPADDVAPVLPCLVVSWSTELLVPM